MHSDLTVFFCIHGCIQIFDTNALGIARCAFVYKDAFQILKLHPGKGGLKPPVASPRPAQRFAPCLERCP